MTLAAATSLLFLGCVTGLMIDHRVLTGLPIWAKPAKFSLSIVVYAITWAWLIAQLRRSHRIAWWFGTVAAAGLTIEIIIIVAQVVRGTTSHFNRTTTLNSTLWDIMGQSIIVVWLATLGVAILLIRNPVADQTRNRAVLLGSWVSVLGMALGILMIFPTKAQQRTHSLIRGAHTVGASDGGPGLPLVGWSTIGGDLRIPHFVGMHALQVIPLIAIMLELMARRIPLLRHPDFRRRLITLAAGVYVALLVLLTWQALRAQSILHPDEITWLVFAAIVFGTTGATLALIRAHHGTDATVHPRRLIAVGSKRAAR
ncbi:hypothetical protein [Nocardia sp. CDC160]|uniref:hypothetical protein n=1 Tax=Nocardia sp. CDC160 TaxID=3112166 RepID=UPI002DBF55E2|nr:hypothetical protein [Nocardia sp. CDC160]MEC3920247.1 hypothetical protein [Nocardia sp. CDC160]